MSDHNAFKCEVCLKHFKQKRNLDSHLLNNHTVDKNGNKFNCKLCGEEFEVQHSLRIHIKDVHGKPKEVHYEKLELAENGQVKCLECNKTYSSIQTAKIHRKNVHMSNHNDRKFICKLCNKDFAVKDYMKKHVKKVHESPTRKAVFNEKQNAHLECLDCKKIFSSKGAAMKHYKKWHMAKNDGNNFTCKGCSQEFSIKYALKIILQKYMTCLKN